MSAPHPKETNDQAVSGDDYGMERAPSAEGLDVNWASVDPAALASLEMALAMGVHGDGPLAKRSKRLAREAEEREAAERTAASLLADGADMAAEFERLEAELREIEHQRQQDDEAGYSSEADEIDEHAAPASTSPNTAPSSDALQPSHEGAAPSPADTVGRERTAAEADEEEGMGCPHGTAEASWGGGEDEWVLERIVRRRQYRGPVGSFDPDVPAEDMRWEYLCAWKGHAEATWERRAFLHDYGFGAAVAAFDAAAAPAKRTTMRAARPQKPPGDRRMRQREAEAELRLRLQQLRERAGAWSQYKNCCLAMHRALESHGDVAEVVAAYFDRVRHSQVPPAWQPLDVSNLPKSMRGLAIDVDRFDSEDPRLKAAVGLVQIIAYQFRITNVALRITSVEFITPQSFAAFQSVVRDTPQTQMRLVFHGTRAASVGPITKKGLLVPRPEVNGLRVVNGSAYGLGVYTADSVATPLGYCRDVNVLFLCLGVIDPATVTEPCGGWKVFADEKYVCPIAKIHFNNSLPYGENTNATWDAHQVLEKFTAFDVK